MAAELVVEDRRQRRRQESIEEILDVALSLMLEQGVGGLSLGEVARQLGIRPPSLYVYFASKNAVYDALFARGGRELLDTINAANQTVMATATTLAEVLTRMGTTLISWAVDHPVYTQLLFWRPVPGFEPSAEAYEPAIDLMRLTTQAFTELQRRGWIRRDVAIDAVVRDFTIVTGGIVSQHLSNEPDQSFAAGRFTTALPSIVAMFTQHYAAPTSATRTSGANTKTTTNTTKEASRVHPRRRDR